MLLFQPNNYFLLRHCLVLGLAIVHQPQMRQIAVGDRRIDYLNSGDWIENLTALEWDGTQWTLYQHPDVREPEEEDQKVDASARELLTWVLAETEVPQ